MDSTVLKVKTKSGLKEIIIIGEFHAYGEKESQWANDLLKNREVDCAFFEGVKEGSGTLDRFSWSLYRLCFRYFKLVTGSNKNLEELVREKNISIFPLEKDTFLPVGTKVGLSILLLLMFFLIIRNVITAFFSHNWWQLVEVLTVLVAVPILSFQVYMRLDASTFNRIFEYLPTNKEKRDKIMSFNLVKYIKELDFRTALVVVGKGHYPQMVTAVKDNFESEEP